MSNQTNSQIPRWLQILGAVSTILVALFGIFQWWYNQNNDDKCGERLSKARETIEEGRNCTNALLKKGEGEVDASEITACYSIEKRGLNDLERIADNCKCASDVRKSAIKEMILFYEGSLEPQKFKTSVEELKSRMKSFN